MNTEQIINVGLEGVVVAETMLSRVDGQNGSLLVAGFELMDICEKSFEEIAELLLGDKLDLGSARCRAFEELQPILDILEQRDPMAALRLGIASLPTDTKPVDIIASVPVILAASKWGKRLLPPNPNNPHVEDFLRLFFAGPVAPNFMAAASSYMVTVAEHGMNASTFCSRVIASTKATPLQSALGGLAALSGPLHGGAPGPVLDLLDELKECADPKARLKQKIISGERLMGFGHRVYRTKDPRAEVLKRAALLLDSSDSLKHAESVEIMATQVLKEEKPDRSLQTNVEFYTCLLYTSPSPRDRQKSRMPSSA